MSPILSKPSSAAPASIFYITIGALLTVWSGIWYWYLWNHPPESDVVLGDPADCLTFTLLSSDTRRALPVSGNVNDHCGDRLVAGVTGVAVIVGATGAVVSSS